MSIEQKINYQLNKFPTLKKILKRVYQLVCWSISKKHKSEGNLIKISPDNTDYEYFFGYYDKSPWNSTGDLILCMQVKNTWNDSEPLESADILIINTVSKSVKKVATTKCWNVQQGCMAQWLGPDFKSKILYNDVRDGKYCSIILNIETMSEQQLPIPCYSVSSDGKTALSLDFSRLHNLRLGYGYAAIPEKTKGINLPDSTAIWKLDIDTCTITELLKYTDFANFKPRPEMYDIESIHKVNHIMISPNGKRFIVLYRWFYKGRKYSRLITCDLDGSNMYLLSDDDVVSHCYWKNDYEILAFERKKREGLGYYLMKDRTDSYIHLWPQLTNDGHPSYSAVDSNLVVTDTYPNRYRMSEIKILNENGNIKTIARVYNPFKYDNETRCDLHPRWKRDGTAICFDAAFEGRRGLYIINL